MTNCKHCHKPMTADEIEYLEDRCCDCETLWHARIQAWRQGAHDPALDAGRFLDMPEVH